ncbi:hypothetical protein ACIBAC_29105 [Streptomyces sp. NPDC051362]|uniref:hypothetical protein n=1 Tax=Streptomyces sp. NPDC051362 TaxID=3365651 RepID=UPI0037A6E2B2
MDASSQTPGPMPPELPTLTAVSLAVEPSGTRFADPWAANPDVPFGQRSPFPEPVSVGPQCAKCGALAGAAEAALRPDPAGRRYPSGAQVLFCTACYPTATVQEAAAAVLDAAMGGDGSATSTELANAERTAGILFDAESVEAAVSAAVAQAHAEDRVELAELHNELAAIAGDHRRVLAIQRLCEGHRGDDLLMVAAIATAAECGSTALDGLPMTLTWNGCLSVDEGKATIECTSSYGGLAELVVTGADRHSLATLLGADVHAVRRECKDKACGTVEDLDASDPALVGWTRVEVAGVEGEPRWYCSAYCVTAGLAQAAEELGQAEVARCVLCGCTEERACPGGCMWVPNAAGIDICTGCATVDEVMAGVAIMAAAEMRTNIDETPGDPSVGGHA